mgnify:CR=1 FL=1
MKSPAQVLSDVNTLTKHISLIREALLKKANVDTAQIGKECRRTSDVLSDLMQSQPVPEQYKVAVVGRFKTGKSSFVNELLGTRLASEDTNPETAAITTFRYGTHVRAKIRFVSREEWQKLCALYAEDPKHIDAHRVKMWQSFGKPRKSSADEDEAFDLSALENQFIKPGGFSLEVELTGEDPKKSVIEFRRRLKEFTSGAKPHHCLVESIDIDSPAVILSEGVQLIDTPGLDDTERFRVSLTEQIVDDVDAILFLTKSGESYSQSDKDFLLSLLRKGTVKQLIVVITQVDVTYQQHLENAEANDEDPEPIGLRIERERLRLAKELATTLAELGQDDSPAMLRYREQLGDIEVAFISTKLHRNNKVGKPVPCMIDPADPGGVDSLTKQLMHLLSTESRLATAAQHIALGARHALLDLQAVLDTKLQAIRDIKDREVAEQTLRNFRQEFGAVSERFEISITAQLKLLEQQLEERTKQHNLFIENISLLAERELSSFETRDLGSHWRTRRSGYWGYMRGLQERVANRIFPKVQEMLSEQTNKFAEFAHAFEIQLQKLAREGSRIAASLDVGASLALDVTTRLTESLDRSLRRAQELIAAEEYRVTSLLDDFVSDEISERIDTARNNVTGIWGSGTTRNQSAEVQRFYRDIKQLLSEALIEHLRLRDQAFGAFLLAEAKTAPRDALGEVSKLLEQAEDNIRAAAEATIAGQKESVANLVANIKAEHRDVLILAEDILASNLSTGNPSSKVGDLPKLAIEHKTCNADTSTRASPNPPELVEDNSSTETPSDGDWAETLQHTATVTVERIRLRDSSTGWPFDKLFAPKYLEGALRVRLVDPYLSKPHQIRNLNDFLLHVSETAHPKSIEVVTAPADDEFALRLDQAFDRTAQDLFKNFGVTITLNRSSGLHDRYLILDHGVLFKLGRGLDIYKPAVGLAEHRSSNRRVRQTDIDIFCLPGHALTSVGESLVA